MQTSWPTDDRQVRAKAEPHLNGWAARLLGNPNRVRCRAEYLNPESDEVLNTRDVRLSELKLSPLDVLCAVQGEEALQLSEIEQRLVYDLIRTRPAGIPVDARVRLDFERSTNWAVDDVSFAEFFEMNNAVARLLTGARAVDDRDLSLPEDSGSGNLDTAELQARADAVVKAFQEVHDRLIHLPEMPGTTDLEALREVLLHAAHLGIPGAVPLSAEGDTPTDRETLLTQAGSIAKEAGRRLQKIQDAEAGFNRNGASAEGLRDHDLARLRGILGPGFRVLPRVRTGNASELAKAFDASDRVQDNHPLAVVTWFQRTARVRDGAARLDAALMYTEALGYNAAFDFRVGQLPHQEGDRWVALPLVSGKPLEGGRLSLVAHMPGGLDPDKPIAGLLIDEWVEVVPNAEETTGVAFNFDEPGAEAPQAVLLAVPPGNSERWDVASLEAILRETLELARLRTVDPEALAEGGELDEFLPLLYIAIDPSGETGSTDFRRAAAPPS